MHVVLYTLNDAQIPPKVYTCIKFDCNFQFSFWDHNVSYKIKQKNPQFSIYQWVNHWHYHQDFECRKCNWTQKCQERSPSLTNPKKYSKPWSSVLHLDNLIRKQYTTYLSLRCEFFDQWFIKPLTWQCQNQWPSSQLCCEGSAGCP